MNCQCFSSPPISVFPIRGYAWMHLVHVCSLFRLETWCHDSFGYLANRSAGSQINWKHQASNIEHRASSIKHRASSIEQASSTSKDTLVLTREADVDRRRLPIAISVILRRYQRVPIPQFAGKGHIHFVWLRQHNNYSMPTTMLCLLSPLGFGMNVDVMF